MRRESHQHSLNSGMMNWSVHSSTWFGVVFVGVVFVGLSKRGRTTDHARTHTHTYNFTPTSPQPLRTSKPTERSQQTPQSRNMTIFPHHPNAWATNLPRYSCI